MDGYLALQNGDRVPVRNGLVLGRIAGCDVVIDDTKCSRKHARLIVEGGVVEVEDLGSSNGTLLNGKPVQRRMLRPGDEIQIGKTVVRYVEGGPAPAAPSTVASKPVAPPDDVDLFDDEGGPPAAPARPAVTAPPAPVPPPRPAVVAPPSPPPPRPSLAQPVTVHIPPRQQPEPAPAVVEFEDEVVSVRKPAAPVAKAGPAPSGPADIKRQQHLLQFHKRVDKGGLFGADFGQIAGSNRIVAILLMLAVAGGLFWLAMTLVG